MKNAIMFPPIYPDEDFRSIVFRYHIRTPNETLITTNKELFGRSSIKNPIFPTRLEKFLRNLPFGHEYDLEKIIYNHTWYGLYKCFIDKKKHKEYMEIFKYGTTNSFWLYNKFHRLFSSKVRYCPKCVKEDIEKYGECYVHRSHQLDFLDFCPCHFVKLLDSCLKCTTELGNNYGSELVRNMHCINEHSICDQIQFVDNKSSTIQFKMDIYKVICYMRDKSELLDASKVYHKMLMRLWNNGFIHYKGRFLKQEIVSSMIDHYSIELIEAINLPRKYVNSKSFISRCLTENLEGDILFYSTLLLYLFKDIDFFIEYEEPIANIIPSGIGPWDCLNPMCSSYKMPVIKKCNRGSKSSGGMCVSSEFSCPICGYTYVKRWHKDKEYKEKVMIKSMGHLWIQKVLKLYSQGYSCNEIAVELKCSEFAVRNNLMKILGINKQLKNEEDREAVRIFIKSYSEAASTNDTLNQQIQDYRNFINSLIRKHNIESRIEIINLASREYHWLKRNDNEWLESNIPKMFNRRKIKSLDLTSFDKQLSQKIEDIAFELYESYPYRIFKSTILRQLSPTEVSRINSMPDRLPLSICTLKNSIENEQRYLIRGLPRVIKVIKKIGYRNITFERIASNYSSYKQCNEETRKEIERLIVGLTLSD
ncbi:TnsD family Tn7-like transposition protein [Fredinandcohnia humi]